jgi:DNA (cytosine-5)-methyltransferase 1
VADAIDVELFAGPGGMTEAARLAGLPSPEIAVEIDPLASATARAAGHPRLVKDVYGLDPRRIVGDRPVARLLGAPPCQGFSGGGLKAGRSDLDAILDLVSCIGSTGDEDHPCGGEDHRGDYLMTMNDHRSILVAEPLRWAVALMPEAVILEQVPSVLPIWEAIAEELEIHGYWTVTGVVNAADFGVPQDRERAVLLASRTSPVELPKPAGERVGAHMVLGPGSIGFPRRADRGASVELNGVAYRARDIRRTELPAFTVTEKARSWTFWPDGGEPRQITVAEAGQLQSFRADYPWQGERSAAFLQAANAHPPVLGAALIAQVLPHATERAA